MSGVFEIAGTKPEEQELPESVSLIDLSEQEPDPSKDILENGFLRAGGGMLFVGPSGIGKSSASVQQDILWALGREAFDIKPVRPLKILCIQAENDIEDLKEMGRGVRQALRITPEEADQIRDTVCYHTERRHTGIQFLEKVVKPLLERHKPDLLRIDPLLAFLGADPSDQKETADFLRTGLNPLLDEFGVAVVINHHTPKVINRDTSHWRGSDWMYAGAGSADITNWCRAAVVIDPTHTQGVFKFILAKRGGRIPWFNPAGERVFEKYFRHATDGRICWERASQDDISKAQTNSQKRSARTLTEDEVIALIPEEGSIPKNQLIERCKQSGMTHQGAINLVQRMLEAREVYEWRVRRSGTNPERRISRHEQPQPPPEPSPEKRPARGAKSRGAKKVKRSRK